MARSRYCNKNYLTQARLLAYLEQFKYVENGDAIVEIGSGAGVFKCLASTIASVDVMDVDPETHPDIIGDVTDISAMAALRGKYNKVFCNQVLEHIPFDEAKTAFRNILNLDAELICLSIPDSRKFIRMNIGLPLIKFHFVLTIFGTGALVDINEHGQHCWELYCANKNEIKDFFVQEAAKQGFILEKNYRFYHRPYQHFFIFKKVLDL
jgi:hypothetical protein